MSGDPSPSTNPHSSRRPLRLAFTVCWLALCASAGPVLSLQYKEHRTAAAAERPNDLRCYVCESMDPAFGQACVAAPGNNTRFAKRCRDDARICMTKQFTVTTSTENTTSEPRLFALERNCTSKCEPGCIVIGERTKLYACTACCETNYCNTGSGSGTSLCGRGCGAGWGPWTVTSLLMLRWALVS